LALHYCAGLIHVVFEITALSLAAIRRKRAMPHEVLAIHLLSGVNGIVDAFSVWTQFTE
jgi:hypothetical protein